MKSRVVAKLCVFCRGIVANEVLPSLRRICLCKTFVSQGMLPHSFVQATLGPQNPDRERGIFVFESAADWTICSSDLASVMTLVSHAQHFRTEAA